MSKGSVVVVGCRTTIYFVVFDTTFPITVSKLSFFNYFICRLCGGKVESGPLLRKSAGV